MGGLREFVQMDKLSDERCWRPLMQFQKHSVILCRRPGPPDDALMKNETLRDPKAIRAEAEFRSRRVRTLGDTSG